MRPARIIGKVTLSRAHACLERASLRLAVPLSLAELHSQSDPQDDSVVVYDQLGAGEGSLIAMSEGSEAAQPFRPEIKPVDAYCAAIIDRVHLQIEL